MKLVALDPSSTKTGYAVFDDDALLDAGLLKPRPSDGTAILRAFTLTDEVRNLLIEHRPDAIVIECPHGKLHRRMGPGAGVGMAIYGLAAGCQLIACREYVRWRKRQGVAIQFATPDPNEWTRGIKKDHRRRCAESDYPGRYSMKADSGGDVADAIYLGRWFMVQAMKLCRTEAA